MMTARATVELSPVENSAMGRRGRVPGTLARAARTPVHPMIVRFAMINPTRRIPIDHVATVRPPGTAKIDRRPLP